MRTSIARPISIVAAAALVSACASGGSGEGDGAAPSSVAIATGGTSGTFYAYGGALASILTDELDGVRANAEATGGSVENLRLLEDGQVQLAQVQAPAAFEAFEGVGDFTEPLEVRTIIAKYQDLVQLSSLDPDVVSFDDLAGRTVSVGDAGSGVELTMERLTAALDTSFDDFGSTVQLGYGDQGSALRNGQIDVGSYLGPPGMSALTDLASTEPLTIVEFTPEQLERVTTEIPYMSEGTVPAGTYAGVDADVEPVPAQWNFVVVLADADRELVRDLTAAAYDNVDRLTSAHPAAEATVPENIENAVTPLHPGAIDYFEEQGIELPDELYPDEWDG